MRYIRLFAVFGFFLPVVLLAQSWRLVDSMHHVRWMSTLTVLCNNKILAVGGIGASDVAINSCEVFDIATAKWHDVASLPTPREHHTATLLPDGKVVVIGGNMGSIYSYDPSQYTSRVEIFDPVTETWSDGGNLLVPRTDQVVVLMPDTTILVIGGYNGAMLTECEIYNPKTKTSRVVGSMSTARIAHEAVTMGTGEVLVAGGYAGPWEGPYFNSCEVYNPVTETWRTIDPMLETRSAGVLARFSDGSILAAGGRGSSTAYVTASDMLDPAAMTWSSVPPMRQEESWQSGMLMLNECYFMTGGVSGGDFSANNAGYSTATCEWYDKFFGCWFYAPSMNIARAKHNAVYVHQEINRNLPEDFIFVAGGFVSQNPDASQDANYTSSAEILNVSLDEVAAYRMSPSNTTGVKESGSAAPVNFAVADNVGATPYATFSIDRAGTVVMDLVATTGAVISHITHATYNAGAYNVPIGVSNVPDGFYFVRFMSPDGNSVAKVVVAH